jgi:hypothetical protein
MVQRQLAPDPVTDGTGLQKRREALGLKCFELADAIGCYRSTLYRWECEDKRWTRRRHRMDTVAGAIALWLIRLPDAEVASVGATIRRYLDKHNIAACQKWLRKRALVDDPVLVHVVDATDQVKPSVL